MTRIFIDTETSGLVPGQIGQLAIITEEENGDIKANNYFFNMDYISDGAEKVTGRNLDFYREASAEKKFADYKDELFRELTRGILIAHNLPFDENFISTEFWRLNMTFRPADRFDTMEYFRDVCKLPNPKNRYKGYKNPKLSELIEYYNIDQEKIELYTKKLFNIQSGTCFHDAMYDTTAMFVAFHVRQDELLRVNNWTSTFCNK